jgi:glycosyltransferase involved in cell wall biosynthesis
MQTLTVLRAHNFYQQPGGEDGVFESEEVLLRNNGHAVVRYEDHNDRIAENPFAVGLNAIWSRSSYRRLERIARAVDLDVAHFHNTFPLISPSAYYALKKHGVPVVQTLHNYRLLCPGATLYREGRVCEECIERRSLRPAVSHACYRGSRAATTAVVAMLAAHRAVGTWREMVDVYISLSEFARRKYIEGGLPADRIVVKPNHVDPDPGLGEGGGGYALFVGRLSEEKGPELLARTWAALGGIPLRVVGDGPLSNMGWPSSVAVLGRQPHSRVMQLMKGASVLVFPSGWFECAPLTILEALACGLPVIAPDLGVMQEMITDHHTGLLFESGNAADLSRRVRWVFDNPEHLLTMRKRARKEFEEKYTACRSYDMLMKIYELASGRARRRAALAGSENAPSAVACQS